MDIQEMLKSMIGLYLLTTPVDTNTTRCGVLKFESPNMFDGVLVVKEGERVNITFSALHRNCSKPDSAIDISIMRTNESVSEFMCIIPPTCHGRSAFNNVSCSCLDTPGFYTLTFFAVRKHSTTWTFSVANADVPNNSVTLNVTYPPNLTRLEIVGYDSYIPKHTFVTVVCSWENGNPPSTVKLLDRLNTSLETGDITGNISYAFAPVECKHAGAIRCEAAGSDRNLTTTMLIECPPEFVQNALSINNVTIGPNDNITFPFRSHTSNISSCLIKLLTQDRKAVTNKFIKAVLKCPKVVENNITVIHDTKHCLYYVTGEPPDLLLVIHVRHLTRQDSGVWHVTVSNDKGSGEIYSQVTVEDGSDRGRSSKADVIIGVTSAAAIVLIIVYIITKGTEAYRRQGSLKNENVLQETLGTDEIARYTVEQFPRQSQMYYEIPDLLESETKAQQFTMVKNDLYSPS